MGVKVDINDIIDANSHTSAMSLTKSWADTFKKYALNKNEELSDDPGSSFNKFLQLTLASMAFSYKFMVTFLNFFNVFISLLKLI